ncbi:MAG: hypothetical protein KI790_11890, partial [Cyclobacteriaceae bacterium]|nr:hypothetical protein [Cyclobacteriaceae bacterium HetDA_MAG_MS6]
MEAYVQFSVEGEYWANLITTFSIFFIAGGTFFFLLILYAVFGIVKDCWRYIAMGMVLGLVINGIWSAAANDRRVEESRLYLYSPYKGRDSAVFELDVDTLQHFPMQLIALEKVKSIKLKSGDLQMLPKNFGDIQNLNSLHINRNPRLDVEQVVGVLEETSISDLQITFCNVRNLPIQLQNINSLQRLDLSYNDDLNLDS